MPKKNQECTSQFCMAEQEWTAWSKFDEIDRFYPVLLAKHWKYPDMWRILNESAVKN